MATRKIAAAGMISDTSLYNIDGACVVGGASGIPVGTFVAVDSAQPVEGHKVVVAAITTAKPAYGVVVRSSYEAPLGAAELRGPVNVLTHGRIWARTSLTVAPPFGSAVNLSAAGIVVADSASGAVSTSYKFAGGFIPAAESPDGVALVEVQLLQSANTASA